MQKQKAADGPLSCFHKGNGHGLLTVLNHGRGALTRPPPQKTDGKKQMQKRLLMASLAVLTRGMGMGSSLCSIKQQTFSKQQTKPLPLPLPWDPTPK